MCDPSVTESERVMEGHVTRNDYVPDRFGGSPILGPFLCFALAQFRLELDARIGSETHL